MPELQPHNIEHYITAPYAY